MPPSLRARTNDVRSGVESNGERDALERGISQRDLARLVGVTEGAISRFLNGEREASFETIDKILDALGLEIVIRPRHDTKGE